MELLLIKPEEITATTPMGGNVDIDKYLPCIFDVQVTVIEPLLGAELYEKIKSDIEGNTLTGDYETLLNSYLKPILRHQVFAEYVEIGAYTVSNAGITKHAPQDSEVVSKNEVQYLAASQRSKAQIYIERAERWLNEKNLPEYKGTCNKKFKVTGGWYL